MRRLFALLFVLTLSVLLVPAQAPGKLRSGTELIRAMHNRYTKNWYKTLTFVQKTVQYKPDGTTESSTWYEALSAPGRLRIDIDPIENGNGILFLNDVQYSIKAGKVANRRERIHPLLLLGFDVYVQPVEVTTQKLEKLKFDLSLIREDTWQGHPVYVVGAKQGDNRTSQFWIDKENLLFVRLIEPTGKDGTSVAETLFNKYQRTTEGGWVSAEVLFNVDGKPVVSEEYSEIRTNVPLDEKLFDPEHWTAASWRKSE
jgi:hypothetical protein